MADLLVGPETTEASAPRRLIGLVITAVAVVVIAGAWLAVAAHQRAQVAVWFDAQPVECAVGTTAVEDLELTFEPLYAVVVDATADLDCVLRVHVEHRGRLPATLRDVVLPYHGPGTGAAIRATVLAPWGLEPADEDPPGLSARDARFAADQPLAGGDRLELRIHLAHQPDGCASPDGYMWVTDAPTVEVSVLGLRGTRAPTGVPFVQRGTADSSCDLP